MLTHLLINDFAIIEKLELELGHGLTVITGETGAGKSIMMDALNLTLGQRADASSVRHGSEKADILAVFDIHDNQAAQAWLQERELYSSEGECILRRVINQDGRSRAFINGKPSPLQDLRNLGETLISIHGQHEHQALLKRDHHRYLVDAYGGLLPQSRKVRETFLGWQKEQQKLDTLRQQLRESQQRFDLLQFQVEELDLIDLGENEYTAIVNEHKQLAHAEETIQNCSQVSELLENEQSQGAVDLLSHSIQMLEEAQASSPSIREINTMLQEALIQSQEAFGSLRDFLDDFEADPQRFQELEDRLASVHQMARKHKVSADKLYQHHQTLREELDTLNNGDAELDALEQRCEELKTEFLQEAHALSSKRGQAAKKLSKKITEEMRQLGMPNGQFEVTVTPLPEQQMSQHGLEQLEFMVTTNPGQPLKSLSKTASGGELSRMSLAIQVICAHSMQVPTMVFDEVDVGISGAIAQVVGQKLHALGDNAQILCITHLPQVAAQGHHHLHVNKVANKRSTSTTISSLSQDEKAVEIARMLGGIELTEQSLAHAKELISQTGKG